MILSVFEIYNIVYFGAVFTSGKIDVTRYQ